MTSVSPPPRPAQAPDLPPHARLLLFISGAQMAYVVFALAELGIADEVARRPRTLAQLAKATSTHEPSLARLLRAAASIGVLSLSDDGRYGETALSQVLRVDHPGSVRDLVRFDASDLVGRPWHGLADAVRTGRRAFDETFGQPFFGYLSEHPEAAELFDRAMTQMSVSTTATFLHRYDFSRHRRIADVGGGRGYFLAMLLERHPRLTGVLFDQPSVLQQAPDLLKRHGVEDRVTVVPGDFFTDVPAGCDAYVLKNVLHDWSDEDAGRILAAVRDSMAGDARLLVCESVLAAPGQPDLAALLDVDMMLKFGGQERDLPSWRALLEQAGLRLLNTPAGGTRAVLECARR